MSSFVCEEGKFAIYNNKYWKNIITHSLVQKTLHIKFDVPQCSENSYLEPNLSLNEKN